MIVQKSYSKIVVLTDGNTHKHCLPILQKELKKHSFISIKIKAGEAYKNWNTVEEIVAQLIKHQIDRHALLINLGGGVVTDIGAFVASIYKRGIDCVHVPTSLLAMVDASIGGKTGIDVQGYKNLLGSFYMPRLVIIHQDFLKTLPSNQLYAGWAEMLKHGLIADEKYFKELCSAADVSNISSVLWKKWIQKSLQIKGDIVAQDPTEKGLRKILNFGHTIGHAIETYSLLHHKKPLLHGEAIAYGMLREAELSMVHAGLNPKEFEFIKARLYQFYGKLFKKVEQQIRDEDWKPYLMQDKKNKNNIVRYALLKAIGKGIYDGEVKG